MPSTYKDIKKPENRLLYLHLLEKSKLFPNDKERLDQLQRIIKTKSNNNEDELTYRPKIKSYADLVALYVNLKEKNFSYDVLEDFRMISRKLGGSFKIEGAPTRSDERKVDFVRDKDGKVVTVSPISKADETLDQKKNRLKASIDSKRRSMLESKMKAI